MLPFKFTASKKYDAVLDLCVTTTTTMHVRTAKALFYVVMHEVYLFQHLSYFCCGNNFFRFCYPLCQLRALITEALRLQNCLGE